MGFFELRIGTVVRFHGSDHGARYRTLERVACGQQGALLVVFEGARRYAIVVLFVSRQAQNEPR